MWHFKTGSKNAIAHGDAGHEGFDVSASLSPPPPSQQHLLSRIRHNRRLKEDIPRPLLDRVRKSDIVVHQKMAQDRLDLRLGKVPPGTCVPAVTKSH